MACNLFRDGDAVERGGVFREKLFGNATTFRIEIGAVQLQYGRVTPLSAPLRSLQQRPQRHPAKTKFLAIIK